MKFLTWPIAFTACFFASGVAASSCSPFSVEVKNPNIVYLDDSETGLSVGDRRVGTYELFSMDGKLQGSFRFTADAVGTSEQGAFLMFGTGAFVFETGTLTAILSYEIADPSETTTRLVNVWTHPISGGTKAYAGAEGTISSRLGDGGKRYYDFDIRCSKGWP